MFIAQKNSLITMAWFFKCRTKLGVSNIFIDVFYTSMSPSKPGLRLDKVKLNIDNSKVGGKSEKVVNSFFPNFQDLHFTVESLSQ